MSDEYAARARRALVGARARWLLRTRALCLADRAQTADSREGQDLQSDLGGCSGGGGGGGGGGAPRCSSAWLCVAAPLWVVVRVCALLREPRPSGMSHEAVAEYRELFDMFASGDAELVPHARMPELLRLCGVYVGTHTFSGEQWRYPEAPHSFGHFIALMDRGWGGRRSTAAPTSEAALAHFATLDVRGAGTIPRARVHSALLALGMIDAASTSEAEVEEFLAEADCVAGDGSVDYAALVGALL